MGAFKDWRMISGKNAQNQKTKKLALLIVKFSLSSLCHIFFNTQNDASHEKKHHVQDPVHVCPQYANTDDSPGSSKNNFALRPQFA
jgi:hypothetical protein